MSKWAWGIVGWGVGRWGVGGQKGRRHTLRWMAKSFEAMGVHRLIGGDADEPVTSTVVAASGFVEVWAVPSARVTVRAHDPEPGVDIEMDAGGAPVEAHQESRFETMSVGGLEIEMPKLGRRKGHGHRNGRSPNHGGAPTWRRSSAATSWRPGACRCPTWCSHRPTR